MKSVDAVWWPRSGNSACGPISTISAGGASWRRNRRRANITQGILGCFLTVLDDLDRALASVGGDAPESWVTGIDIVRRRFLSVLEEQGLTRLEAVGQPFDPEKHEAMLRVEDSGQPPNTIVEELRPGYICGTRVIRPALVKVQA